MGGGEDGGWHISCFEQHGVTPSLPITPAQPAWHSDGSWKHVIPLYPSLLSQPGTTAQGGAGGAAGGWHISCFEQHGVVPSLPITPTQPA